METAYFAAGCFWGVESFFQGVEGVSETEVGYMGGHSVHPSYEDVCRGDSGHAETVKVVFDPARISYKDLVAAFWQCHNPTTPNRQGPDVGSQYRSAIFYASKKQEQEAKESLQALTESGRFQDKIVTEISPAGTFYRAEEYHQKYNAKKGKGSHCLFSQ